MEVLFILGGLIGLVWGANLLVDAASEIARGLGVSELVIGLTLVAIGTSLPEVAASLVAVFRGKTDLAVGNVVGSNLFNILGIAGITALVQPLATPPNMEIDFFIMLLLTGLVLVFAWRKPNLIRRWHAIVLLGIYVLFIAQLVVRSFAA
jgi:cation:H+ antiporter